MTKLSIPSRVLAAGIIFGLASCGSPTPTPTATPSYQDFAKDKVVNQFSIIAVPAAGKFYTLKPGEPADGAREYIANFPSYTQKQEFCLTVLQGKLQYFQAEKPSNCDASPPVEGTTTVRLK